jgi:hypothetical protein
MIVFDHLKLVRRRPCEMKRFRNWVLANRPGDLERVVVEHESNGSCCRTR